MELTICYPADYARLRTHLAIDILRFSEELIAVPQLIQEAAEFAAEAGCARDGSKQLRDIAIADAASTLRNVEGKPPSETQINSEINLINTVQDARTAYAEAERDYEVWRSLVDALKNKKEILRTLSDQIVAGFMSPTSFTQDARRELNDARQAKAQQRRRVPE